MNTTKIKCVLTALIVFCCSIQIYAQKYTAEFLNMGVGARALGMGGAFVAIANDATACYWNPAGLALLRQREMTMMHATRFSGIVHSNFVNFVYPDQKGNAFGISWFRIGVDDIPKSTKLDEFNRPIIEGYMKNVDQAIFLSYSRQAAEKLYLGGNIKAIRQTVGDNSALGFGLDLAVLYRLANCVSLGLNLQDLAGTFIYWDTGHRDTKNPTLKWGVAFTKSFSKLKGDLTLAVDQNIRFEGETNENTFSVGDFAGSDFQFGAEYWLFNLIAFRAGLDRQYLTAGTGLKLKMFEIDYAFVSYELGNTHRISGRVRF